DRRSYWHPITYVNWSLCQTIATGYHYRPYLPNARHAWAGEDHRPNVPTSLNKRPCLPRNCSDPGQRPCTFLFLSADRLPHLAPHPCIFCPLDNLHNAMGQIWKSCDRPLFCPQNLRSTPNFDRSIIFSRPFSPSPTNAVGQPP